jgi:hypothetical protein
LGSLAICRAEPIRASKAEGVSEGGRRWLPADPEGLRMFVGGSSGSGDERSLGGGA